MTQCRELLIITEEVPNTIHVLGEQGPPGPPGPDGAASVARSAGEPLSALRVVYERDGQAFLLNPDVTADVDLLLGLTLNAAGSAGNNVNIRLAGTVDDDSWNWSEGLVFAGPNGTLTQTPPETGWEIVVGSAPSPTRLNLSFDEPVLLD